MDNSLPVYLVPLEDLEHDNISSSFDNFIEILKMIQTLSDDRKNPVELENNSLPENIRDNFLSRIEEKNPNCELQFWESVLKNSRKCIKSCTLKGSSLYISLRRFRECYIYYK